MKLLGKLAGRVVLCFPVKSVCLFL